MTMNIYKYIYKNIFTDLELFINISEINKPSYYFDSITFKKNYTDINDLINKYIKCYNLINDEDHFVANGKKCILEGLFYLAMLLDIISNFQKSYNFNNKITNDNEYYTLNTNTPIRMYFQVKEVKPFITDAYKYINNLITQLKIQELSSYSRYYYHLKKTSQIGGKRNKKKTGGVGTQQLFNYISDYEIFINDKNIQPNINIKSKNLKGMADTSIRSDNNINIKSKNLTDMADANIRSDNINVTFKNLTGMADASIRSDNIKEFLKFKLGE